MTWDISIVHVTIPLAGSIPDLKRVYARKRLLHTLVCVCAYLFRGQYHGKMHKRDTTYSRCAIHNTCRYLSINICCKYRKHEYINFSVVEQVVSTERFTDENYLQALNTSVFNAA